MRRSYRGMLLATVCVALWAVPVLAQPGQGRGFGGGFGGGRGGFGGGDNSMMLLGAEQIQTELNISDEQKEQITALREESQANMPDFRQAFQELGEDATEEERNAVFAEMRTAMEAAQAETKAKLAEILAADQLDRLRQLRWQLGGLDSLRDAEAAEAVGLSDEQKTELTELLDERGQARRELGFQASEEDRAAFNEEWNTKIESVLTEEQRETWTVLLGDTFEFDRAQLFGGFGGGRGQGGPGGPGGFGPGGGGFGPGGPGGGRPGGRPQSEDEDEDEGTDDDEV